MILINEQVENHRGKNEITKLSKNYLTGMSNGQNAFVLLPPIRSRES